jgi:hypothetical protein
LKYFLAATYGSRVKNAIFTGQIHSVFANACNIQLNKGGIVTLLVHTKEDQPGGIRLLTPNEFYFLDWIKSGEHVSCQQGCLQIKEPNFLVDMRHATLWQENLPNILAVSQVHVSRQWQTAANLFAAFTDQYNNGGKQINKKNLGLNFQPNLYSQAMKLTQAIREQDWPKIDTAFRSLIGFGPGLTPWGDDFICGFLSGYECLAENLKQKRNLNRLRSILLKNIGKTGDISQAMLSDAATGQHNKSVVETCQALFASHRADNLTSSIHQLLGIGDTSGAANCFGILSSIVGTDGFGDLYKNDYLPMISDLAGETFAYELEKAS